MKSRIYLKYKGEMEVGLRVLGTKEQPNYNIYIVYPQLSKEESRKRKDKAKILMNFRDVNADFGLKMQVAAEKLNKGELQISQLEKFLEY